MLKRLYKYGLLILLATSVSLPSYSSELPIIGDTTSSIISLDQEHKLGRVWARMLRGRAPELSDPLTVNYLDGLLWELAASSQLQDHRLELIVLDNSTLNAFAVPGGIVGINSGLILGAHDEEELASVVAHELAHLSQRHYAQQLEESRRNRPFLLAAMLASILVAAADTEAGVAGISGTIAAGQQAGLAFSRRNEQEADRIGMLNLVAAGFDPLAMPRMFSRIQRSTRFLGQRPPEFLLTHPVTESRIADAENRARQLPKNAYRDYRYDFPLIQKRLQVHYTAQLQTLTKELAENATSDSVSRYGLALAHMKANHLDKANEALAGLSPALKNHLFVKLTKAELLLAEKKNTEASSLLKLLDQLYPGSYPVSVLYAKALRADNQAKASAQILESLSQRYPTNSFIWYELAETYGLAGNTLGVHEARIEYFLLIGAVDRAIRQIGFALKEKQLTSSDIARLEQRKQEAVAIRQQIKDGF
ncbi:MAG: M48 family metalloprotease [Amphritea sp.]